jgi:hypothetical protein
MQTAQHLPYPKLTWKSLDELDAGVCDGMTYEVRELLAGAVFMELIQYSVGNRGKSSVGDAGMLIMTVMQ